MKGAQIALIVGGILVTGVAVMAFIPGSGVEFKLPTVSSFRPKAKESATRARMASMSGLTGRFNGADTDYTLDEADVYTSGAMGDTDQFSFNDMVACWATQANFNERINTGWWGVTVDDSQCPDGGNGNGIMNFWMRGTKPLLFGLFRPTVLELVFYDTDAEAGSQDAVYLVASVTEDASIENPIGSYFIQMFMEPSDPEAENAQSIQYNVFTHKTEDDINALLATVKYGGDSSISSFQMAMVVDPEADTGLILQAYGAEAFGEDSDAPDGCLLVSLAAWNPDYAYNPDYLFSPECGDWTPEGFDPEDLDNGDACYTRSDYTETCWEYKLYDATTGDRLEGLSRVSGDTSNNDYVHCRRSDTTAATCCNVWNQDDGEETTPDLPLTFQEWTRDGRVDVTIDTPASATDSCQSWEIEVDLVFDGEATTLVEELQFTYSHTTGNDRNGATNPGDGSWENIDLSYDYQWLSIDDNIVLADGASIGSYVVRCMGIGQVFEKTDPSNCPTGVTSYPTNLFDGVELAYLTEYPDDMPSTGPTADEIEVFVGEDL